MDEEHSSVKIMAILSIGKLCLQHTSHLSCSSFAALLLNALTSLHSLCHCSYLLSIIMQDKTKSNHIKVTLTPSSYKFKNKKDIKFFIPQNTLKKWEIWLCQVNPEPVKSPLKPYAG